MKSLAVTMDWLKDEVQLRGRDVGFCGEMEDVISHAAQLLGSHLINIRSDGTHLIEHNINFLSI